MKNLLIILVFISGVFSTNYADELYIGARGIATEWQPAVIQAANNLATKSSTSSLISTSSRQFVKGIENDSTLLVMKGANITYIKGLYSINYSAFLGDSKFKYTTHEYIYNNSSVKYIKVDYDTAYKVNRVDHDFSISKLLGRKGFYIFGGLKKQTYSYDISQPPALGLSYESNSFNLGLMSVPNTPYGNIRFNSYGPALGLGFVKALDETNSFNLAVGLIYLQSTYRLTQSPVILVTKSDGSISDTSEYFKHTETMRIKGFTINLGYNRKVTENGILQIGFIYQQSQMKTIDSEGYFVSKSSLTENYLNGLFQSKFGSTDGLTDIFKGIVLGFQYKL